MTIFWKDMSIEYSPRRKKIEMKKMEMKRRLCGDSIAIISSKIKVFSTNISVATLLKSFPPKYEGPCQILIEIRLQQI